MDLQEPKEGRAADFADFAGERQGPFAEEGLWKLDPDEEPFASTSASLDKLENGEYAAFNQLRPSYRRNILFQIGVDQTPSEVPCRNQTAAFRRSLRTLQQKAGQTIMVQAWREQVQEIGREAAAALVVPRSGKEKKKSEAYLERRTEKKNLKKGHPKKSI